MDQGMGNCPSCEKPFKDGEDVVICPHCGAPYHRECYAKEGRCLFEARHGDGFEYQLPTARAHPPGGKEEAKNGYVPPTQKDGRTRQQRGGVLCQNCKTVNDVRNIFCEKCGNPLRGEYAAQSGETGAPPPIPGFGRAFSPFGRGAAPPPVFGQGAPGYGPGRGFDYSGEIAHISKQEWAEYIGNAAPVYLGRMDQMQQHGRKIAFMPSAFFLSEFYFAYRKMWGWAALGFLLDLAVALVQVFWMVSEMGVALPVAIPADWLYTANSVITYIYWLVKFAMGLFALYLYQKSGVKRITALKKKAGEGPEYHASLRQKGGVSALAVVLLGLLLVVFVYIAVPALLGQDALLAIYEQVLETMPL